MSLIITADDLSSGTFVAIHSLRVGRRIRVHRSDNVETAIELDDPAPVPAPLGVPLKVIGISLPFIACAVLRPGGGLDGPVIIDLRDLQLSRLTADFVTASSSSHRAMDRQSHRTTANCRDLNNTNSNSPHPDCPNMTDSTNPSITCPDCGTSIKLTETLAAPLLDAERRKLREEHRKRAHALRQRAQVLCEQEEQVERAQHTLEQEVRRRVDAEREAIRGEEQAKASEGAAADLKAAQMAVAEKEKQLRAAQEAELALRRDRAALENEKREFDLRLARTLDAERDKIRAQTRKEDEEATRLRLAEKEETISRMRQQIEELRRRSEQGSQELQGEVQERALETTLRERFPFDQIESVPNGRRGADVLHRVVSNDGQVCGTILWESKRTKNFSQAWLPKLRDDQRAQRADLAVLMTEVLPNGLDTFGKVDGVWVTSRPCALPLAAALRHALIGVAATRRAFEGQKGKMELLYEYLTGPQFRQRIEAIIDPVVTMRTELDAEKRAMLRLWARREKQIERLLVGSAGLHGDLQGIAGTSLCSIEKLELPQLGDDSAPSDDLGSGSSSAA